LDPRIGLEKPGQTKDASSDALGPVGEKPQWVDTTSIVGNWSAIQARILTLGINSLAESNPDGCKTLQPNGYFYSLFDRKREDTRNRVRPPSFPLHSTSILATRLASLRSPSCDRVWCWRIPIS